MVTSEEGPPVRLLAVDEPVLEQLVQVAVADASADEVTPPLDAGSEWTPARIAWLEQFHRDRRMGFAGAAGEATWAVAIGDTVVGSVRLKRAAAGHAGSAVPFPIQGSGEETRSFCHIDDLVQGVLVMREKGDHLGIYHIGTPEEVTIADLARRMAGIAGCEIVLRPSALLAGSTPRRWPDISKVAALGYRPRVPLDVGLPPTVRWYWEREGAAQAAELR